LVWVAGAMGVVDRGGCEGLIWGVRGLRSGMIHTVYFWLKDGLTDEQVAFFEGELAKMTMIETVGSGVVGKPAATASRPVTDHSFGYHLSLTFASIADHDAYQVHPDHDDFVASCKDLWERVVVYDSE
jgi:hypothetical protein